MTRVSDVRRPRSPQPGRRLKTKTHHRTPREERTLESATTHILIIVIIFVYAFIFSDNGLWDAVPRDHGWTTMLRPS